MNDLSNLLTEMRRANLERRRRLQQVESATGRVGAVRSVSNFNASVGKDKPEVSKGETQSVSESIQRGVQAATESAVGQVVATVAFVVAGAYIVYQLGVIGPRTVGTVTALFIGIFGLAVSFYSWFDQAVTRQEADSNHVHEVNRKLNNPEAADRLHSMLVAVLKRQRGGLTADQEAMLTENKADIAQTATTWVHDSYGEMSDSRQRSRSLGTNDARETVAAE